eukprot:5580808-Pyramimonas_sp.AAC.1
MWSLADSQRLNELVARGFVSREALLASFTSSLSESALEDSRCRFIPSAKMQPRPQKRAKGKGRGRQNRPPEQGRGWGRLAPSPVMWDVVGGPAS